ncbi:MAG TPA: DUF4153 domain-containing protein [bacterium]|nr:DUF4153 domain-containing protein [bacterium]
MKEKILQAADSPRELEALYRAQPKEFNQAFMAAYAERNDSLVLQAWKERLFFSATGAMSESSGASRWRIGDISLVIVLSLIAGTLAKLPHFFSAVNENWFYSRNLAGIVIGALIAYFCFQRQCGKKTAAILSILFFGGMLYLNLLPDKSISQSIALACLHMPVFFWALLGVSFLAGSWQNLPGRMDYVRYNGEVVVYSTVILIGGVVLTALTLGLFELIELKIEQWYFKTVAIYGGIAAPIVATLIGERIVGTRFKIAPLLAKVFTPLFLVMALAYLVAMAIQQKSPFTDRDFLIAFNGLLLVVLALCVFSISERGTTARFAVADFLNIGLVLVTLIIDLIALAAILFRLTSYGYTPNRLAVLGANLLVFCHLAGILYLYVRFVVKRQSLTSLDQWIVGYLPVYVIWSVFVAVAFPLIFSFK